MGSRAFHEHTYVVIGEIGHHLCKVLIRQLTRLSGNLFGDYKASR